jgi:uncharacterized protein YggE
MATSALAQESPTGLDVQAEARLERVPDIATLDARLWERTPAIPLRVDTSSDPDALREARDRLEERATTLIRDLEAEGLAREAISAGSLNIQPEHVQERRTLEGDHETLVRTRLERPFQVEIDDLEQLPRFLDALTRAGVNALDGVTYDLADREAASDEALVMALEKAAHKARLMADTLGVTLGPVTHISETRSPILESRMMTMSADARQGGPQVEYRPGTLTIEAGVSLSWVIE